MIKGETDIVVRLEQWPSANEAERGLVVEALYQELKRLANHMLGGRQRTLEPTALVNEAYERLIGVDRIEWQGRKHFLGVAARIMRQIAIDEARRNQAQKRDKGLQTTLATDIAGESTNVVSLIDVEKALSELEQVDPVYGQIVEARVFAGMTITETAALLEVSEPTVKRKWVAARTWLFEKLAEIESEHQPCV